MADQEGIDMNKDTDSKARAALEALQREMDAYPADTLGDDPQEFDQWRVLYDAAVAIRGLLDRTARLDTAIRAALNATDSVGDQIIWDSAEAYDILEAARDAS
jgi:hypothetical protein